MFCVANVPCWVYVSAKVVGSVLVPTPHQRVHLRVFHHQPSGAVKALPFLHEKVDVLGGYGGEVHLARISVAYGAHSTTYHPPINNQSTTNQPPLPVTRTKTAFTLTSLNNLHRTSPRAWPPRVDERRSSQNSNLSTKISPASASREDCLLSNL